jgi:hypothetical protein
VVLTLAWCTRSAPTLVPFRLAKYFSPTRGRPTWYVHLRLCRLELVKCMGGCSRFRIQHVADLGFCVSGPSTAQSVLPQWLWLSDPRRQGPLQPKLRGWCQTAKVRTTHHNQPTRWGFRKKAQQCSQMMILVAEEIAWNGFVTQCRLTPT